MKITFEQYLHERIHMYDNSEAQVFEEQYIDCDTGQVFDKYRTDYEKVDYLISRLDEKYRDSFKGEYILHKVHDKNKWTVYKIDELLPFDLHNGQIQVQHIGANFKENNYKRLFIRKGTYKSVTKDEIIDMYGWHDPKNKRYETKYLYIVKNELGRVKIGQATNVEQRVSAMAMSSGVELELIKKIENSAKYEKVLHKHFSNVKYVGEWYNLSEDDIAWLKNLNAISIEIEMDYIKNKLL